MEQSKEEYIEKYYKSAFCYEEDIKSGKVLACQYIHQAIARRQELHEKYHYSEKEVKKVIDFLYYVNLTQDGKVSRFEPAPWQMFIIMNVYGYFTDKACKKRLFRDVLVWIARKSGKTTLGAILGIYSLVKEERSAESYVLATTQAQASQALKYSKEIVKTSPALRKRIRVMQYKLLSEERGTGIFKALASNAETLDGLNPSFAIIDEAHAHPTKDLYNILKTGMLSRVNPMMLTISTAGNFKEYPFFNDVEIGKKVLNGDIEDDSTFYALFTLDSEEEIEDPKNWIKSNPSLDVTISLDDMIIAYKKACLTSSDRINFEVKNLNLYRNSETTWIPDADYKKCFNEVDESALKGKKAYLGLDLSATRDMASLVVIVEGEDGKINVIPEIYFPTKDNESNKMRKSGIDLGPWIEKGFIIEHKNKIIDYEQILQRIKYYTDNFDVQGLAYDPWNSTILMSKIEAELIIDLYSFKQTAGYFNFPLKYIERLIYSEQINLSSNPVLRWHFSNVNIYRDTNDNIKIQKNKAKDSVDSVVSLAMAVGLYAKINFDAVSVVMDAYYGNALEINQKEN